MDSLFGVAVSAEAHPVVIPDHAPQYCRTGVPPCGTTVAVVNRLYQLAFFHAVELPKVQQAALSFGAFNVIEEVGPPHLRDFMLQREFGSTLIDEPSSCDQGHIRCEDSPCRCRGSHVVDHVDPDVRFETQRSDLSYEVPTSFLEEASDRRWIGRICYRNASTYLHRPEGLDVER